MSEAQKFDAEKPRWDLVPYDALEEVVEILGFGAKKYGDRNWEGGFDWSRLIGAAFRHLTSFTMGEDLDKESGKSHLAHCMCCLLFLLAHKKRNLGFDDRSKPCQSK